MAGTLASQSFPAPTMKREHDQMLQAGQASFMSAPDHSYLHPQATSFSPQKSTQFPPTINPTSNQIHAAPLAVMTAPSLGGPLRPSEKPQIYTAMYSGVKVYEMEVNGVACMRRRADGWLNATQILKVAGVEKGKRTKVLEKEVLNGEHEKVQGGYGKYQGTWINYERGRDFCRQYGVEQALLPLLEHDRGNDGSKMQDTPTKEQAIAAQRKRLWISSVDQKGINPQSGTFFSSISPMSSVALSAMEKAARLNTPMTKPGSRLSTSRASDIGIGGPDSAYGTQEIGVHSEEPARKRVRMDNGGIDTSLDHTFSIEQPPLVDGVPVTLSPLPAPSDDETEDKRALLLDLFSDQVLADYSSHPALNQLNPEDYDLPLDASANTTLHWAATLARTQIVQLLIQKGANIWRGNAAGQSALISAVLVNNCSDSSCFPQLLELLSPLIGVRDAQGRTILHHIAIACGIKGRAPSSKYYLEALLEHLVRNTTSKNNDRSPMTLMNFLSTIVNAQDKGGNTALNLVARIGNRSIIQQLLEIRADPSIPNHKGVSAKDFGVGLESDMFSGQIVSLAQSGSQSTPIMAMKTVGKEGALEEQHEDVLASLKTLLDSNMQKHKTLLAQKTSQIDTLTKEIKDLSAQQASETQTLNDLQQRIHIREDRQRRIANLARYIDVSTKPTKPTSSSSEQQKTFGITDQMLESVLATATNSSSSLRDLNLQQLRALHKAYKANENLLHKENNSLKSRSVEIESLYRKVISLCTGVPEDKIDEMLTSLVAAVESESSNLAHVNVSRNTAGNLGESTHGGMAGLGAARVREFLSLVDGVGNGNLQPSNNSLNRVNPLQAWTSPPMNAPSDQPDHREVAMSSLDIRTPLGHRQAQSSVSTVIGPSPRDKRRNGATNRAPPINDDMMVDAI